MSEHIVEKKTYYGVFASLMVLLTATVVIDNAGSEAELGARIERLVERLRKET